MRSIQNTIGRLKVSSKIKANAEITNKENSFNESKGEERKKRKKNKCFLFINLNERERETILHLKCICTSAMHTNTLKIVKTFGQSIGLTCNLFAQSYACRKQFQLMPFNLNTNKQIRNLSLLSYLFRTLPHQILLLKKRIKQRSCAWHIPFKVVNVNALQCDIALRISRR